MFCMNCGNKLKEGATFCAGCGAKVAQQDSVAQPAMQPTVPPVIHPQSTTPKRSGLAIGAFIVSFFLPILGLILGIVSMSKIRRTGARGRGFSIAAIAISATTMVINTILMVVLIVPAVRCEIEGTFDCWYCRMFHVTANQNRTAVEYLDAQDQGELYAAIAEVRDMGLDLAITVDGDALVYTYTFLELIYTDAFAVDESALRMQAELILSEMGEFGVQNPVVRFIYRNADGAILYQIDFWIVS